MEYLNDLETAVSTKVFAPGSLLEMNEELIEYPERNAPHHEGVMHTVFPNAPQTMLDLFQVPAMRGALDKDFLVYKSKRFTFGETMDAAAALGYVLVNSFGVKTGDRVCILSKNRPEYVIGLVAATSIGAVAVPMNSWWKTKELEYGLSHSGSRVVICDADRFKNLVPILDNLPELEKVLLLSGPGSSSQPSHPRRELFDEVVQSGKGKAMPIFDGHKDSSAILMYTSGTTGFPKGVVLTHRGVAHALTAAVAHGVFMKAVELAKSQKAGTNPADGQDSQEKNPAVLLNVPLFHATGLHAILMISFLSCRKLVMMPNWDPLEALRLIERERITSFTGVPTMSIQMMNHPSFNEFDTSSLSSVGGGGAAAPPSMVKDIGSKFKKASPGQGYGMTETNAFICLIGGEEFKARPSSTGRPSPGNIVEIWDEEGNRLPVGQRGRVMFKGAGLMKEYFKNPSATAKVVTREGFLDTGDVGHLDSAGYLHLGGRNKDMIIRGGENISSAVVENAVYEHPAVAEVAAIPVPHPTLGEEVGIVVHPKGGMEKDVTLESIQKTCSELAYFQMPTHIYIWNTELPRGATGKIVKREIIESIKNEKILSEQQKSAL